MTADFGNLSAEIVELSAALCDGVATADQRQRLGQLLHDHPQLRQDYVELMVLHALLAAKQVLPLELHSESSETAARRDGEPALRATPAPLTEGRLAAPVMGWRSLIQDFAKEPLAVAILVLVMICSGVLVWHLSRLPSQQVAGGGSTYSVLPAPAAALNQPDADSPRVSKAPMIARLARSVDAAWEQEGTWGDGMSLVANQKLTLRHGLAEIAFNSGATVVIEGPAELEIGDRKSEVTVPKPPTTDLRPPTSDNSCTLTLGKLVARVPESAHGFTVTTPTMQIVDLGTEFGVSVLGVDADSTTAVHVLRGEVSVRPAIDDLARAPATIPPTSDLRSPTSAPTILKSGEAIIGGPAGMNPHRVQAEPARFVRELPPAEVAASGAVTAKPGASALRLMPGDILAVSRDTLKLVKINPKTGEQKVLARGNRDLHGWEWMCVAVDAQGKILVGTDRGQGRGGQVLRIDGRDGSIKVLASDGLMAAGRISGLVVAANGVIYAAQDGPEDKILEINPQNGNASTVVPFGNNIWGIATDVGGRDLLAISDGGDALAQIRGQTVSTWVRNPMFEGAPRGVAVRPDGRVFVSATSHTHGKIVEVDRASYRLTEIVSVSRRDWSFGLPAIEPDGNLIVGNDAPESSVYRVDVDARTIVPISSTEHLERVLGVAVVPGRLASAKEKAP